MILERVIYPCKYSVRIENPIINTLCKHTIGTCQCQLVWREKVHNSNNRFFRSHYLQKVFYFLIEIGARLVLAPTSPYYSLTFETAIPVSTMSSCPAFFAKTFAKYNPFSGS